MKSLDIMSSGMTRQNVITKLKRWRENQKELDKLRETEQDPSVLERGAFLADILGLVESVAESYQQNGGFTVHPLMKEKKQSQPADYFLREEIRKYVRIKPNRLGKQNFMGANATFTSIGHACFAMKEELEEYMDYDIGEFCNDDWKLAQKLMVHGCDPLPRRRCFSRAPKLSHKPYPINESMWKLPDDRNVRWSKYRWVRLEGDPSETADFLMSEVLGMKPGEIRIGLDFSVGTGTFAARMREFNVTIAFKMLRYKRHKWVVVPKLDKDHQEVFFSAVLEKPPRPFR
ncbi:hypothetical protein SESBI_32709 [Sesbania bispinosa]|nr:hypothetical protein SESBI_32709 [Sesbania bispinosa]